MKSFCIKFGKLLAYTKNIFLSDMAAGERCWLSFVDRDGMDGESDVGVEAFYFDGNTYRFQWPGLAGEVYFRADEKGERYQMFYSPEQLTGDVEDNIVCSDVFSGILDNCNHLEWRSFRHDKVFLTDSLVLLLPSTDGKELYMAIILKPVHEAKLRYWAERCFRVDSVAYDVRFEEGKIVSVEEICCVDKEEAEYVFDLDDYIKYVRSFPNASFRSWDYVKEYYGITHHNHICIGNELYVGISSIL